MRKIGSAILSSAIYLLTFSAANAQLAADEKKAICDGQTSLAGGWIIARMDGLSLAEAMLRAGDVPEVRRLVLSAYTFPAANKVESSEERMEVVVQFRNKVELDCYLSLEH